jgi:hypothetical protein
MVRKTPAKIGTPGSARTLATARMPVRVGTPATARNANISNKRDVSDSENIRS